MFGGLAGRLRPYWRLAPQVLAYQIASRALLGVFLAGFRRLMAWFLASQGRVALTTGDFAFLFTSWQGWVIIAVWIVLLYLYVAVDLNAKVALAGHIFRYEETTFFQTLREGVAASRRFACLEGAAVVAYIALIAPVIGVGASISLTERLQIPNFVSSVIMASPLYRAGYWAVFAIFALVGFFNLFCVYGVVLRGMSVRDSRRVSKILMRRYWLDYVRGYLGFGAGYAVSFLLIAIVFLGVPLWALAVLELPVVARRPIMLFVCLVGIAVVYLHSMLFVPFSLIKTTQLYLGYERGERFSLPVRAKRRHPLMRFAVVAVLVACVVSSAVLSDSFDVMFPAEAGAQVIAHRAGGSEGPENTVAGIDAAVDAGAWGAEIDVQRTRDGAYVICHDTTFARVAGVPRRPSEMTLAEIRELRVTGILGLGSHAEPVPTLEEMLEASHDRVILFIELKGATADRQMADDVVRMVRDAGMVDQCVIISLKYGVIDYIETAYPDIQTGFLAFASYGDIGALNCDYIALEELAATSDAIEAIHLQGKKALVWTVNEESSQYRFLGSEADAIITDNVSQARDVRERLSSRSDLERIVGTVISNI